MIRWLFPLFFALTLHAQVQYRIENSNFTISQGSQLQNGDTYLYNYDRLRLRLDYTQDQYFATFIADTINYLGGTYVDSNDFAYVKSRHSDTPFKTQTTFHNYGDGAAYAKIYRAYAGYEDLQNRVIAGVINISMGVGRIWTPTNLFNPPNTYALESDEVFGVSGISYTRHLNAMSDLTVVATQKEDKTLKYAVKYKAFLELADVGVDILYSDTTKMLGYELEGNLADTGVELRSEGAYIKTKLNSLAATKDEELFQAIAGADYGFVNGITLIGEALYTSKRFSTQEILQNLQSDILSNMNGSYLYGATSLSYSFNIFLDGSLTYIESFNKQNSRFISPLLTYNFNDYNTFNIGATIFNGVKNSEFGNVGDSYYFRWNLSF